MIRGVQPETVRDYTLEYRTERDGDWKTLATVNGNYQRMVRHTFEPVKAQAMRLNITATNGDKLARVFEVRCYPSS